LNRAVFLEAAGAVMKIGSILKPNHHQEIWLAQIGETLCSCAYCSQFHQHFTSNFFADTFAPKN